MCGEWSTYGVPGGNEEGGRTEWKMDWILPVTVEMTMVAADSLLPMMARDEASTVMSAGCAECIAESSVEAGASVA